VSFCHGFAQHQGGSNAHDSGQDCLRINRESVTNSESVQSLPKIPKHVRAGGGGWQMAESVTRKWMTTTVADHTQSHATYYQQYCTENCTDTNDKTLPTRKPS